METAAVLMPGFRSNLGGEHLTAGLAELTYEHIILNGDVIHVW